VKGTGKMHVKGGIMAKPVQLKLSSKQTILVEPDDSVAPPNSAAPPGYTLVVSVKDVIRDFSEVKGLIVAFSNDMMSALAEIPLPSKATIEFGIKFGGEGGLPMISKVSAEAGIKVSVEWQPKQPTTTP
jgi:hypothetical protein